MLNRIIGILGWLGTALVFAAVAVRYRTPEMQRLWTGLALAGLVCVLLYMLAQWRDVVRALSGRQARFGALAVSSILIVICILTGINYIASRQNKRWDLTAAKQFSLSDQTRQILQNLKAPVTIHVFGRDDDFERFRDRLREYEYASKQVLVEYVDIDKKPAQARQYEVQAYGTVVVEYEKRAERVVADTEQEITNALIKAVEGQQKKVYFVQGHGEKDTASSERNGYSAIVTALANDNFTIDKLVLAQQTDVPSDASVLIVAGPKTDLLEPETVLIRKYLRRGGKLLFLIDPTTGPDVRRPDGIIALLREWAIEVGDNVVVDVSGIGQLIGTDASVPVVAEYPSHAITQRLNNLLTAYPIARSVSPIAAGVEGRYAQTFIETSARSWAETDMQTLTAKGQVNLDLDKGDKQGPVSIAASVSGAAPDAPASAAVADKDGKTGQAPETRLAVVGDSDFASNSALGIAGNRDLFLNIVNWLAQQENLISIRARQPDDRRITLTAGARRGFFLLSIFIIPGIVLITGVYNWWRRR